MRDIPFVDAHVHLWDLARLRYSWLTAPFASDGPNGSVEPIAVDYLPADYRADAVNWSLAGAVHIDAGADAADALAETEWLEAQADATGLPSAIVAFAALDAVDVDALLARHAAHGRVRGIRHIVNWHADPVRSYTPRDVSRDPAWERGFALLATHGLSFDLQCYPGQMPHIAAICARHSEVPVMINHLGMPVLTDPEGLADWRRGMAALAALPQVSVKLSGFGFIRRDWDGEVIRPLLRETIDLFGPRRVMAASDFPTDKLFAEFDGVLQVQADVLAGFGDDERRDIWGRNAVRLYRLDLDHGQSGQR